MTASSVPDRMGVAIPGRVYEHGGLVADSGLPGLGARLDACPGRQMSKIQAAGDVRLRGSAAGTGLRTSHYRPYEPSGGIEWRRGTLDRVHAEPHGAAARPLRARHGNPRARMLEDAL